MSAQQLAALGIMPDTLCRYVQAGYLRRLGRGYFVLKSDEVDGNGVAKVFTELYPGIHVGANTALSYYGIYHNVYAKPSVILTGAERVNLPEWTKDYRVQYIPLNLFDLSDEIGQRLAETSVKECPLAPFHLRCSVPERAILEAVAEVGRTQDIEEVQNLFGSMSSPRFHVLGSLLERCVSLRTKRLFFRLAKHNTLWDFTPKDLTSKFQITLGSAYRWPITLQNGQKVLI